MWGHRWRDLKADLRRITDRLDSVERAQRAAAEPNEQSEAIFHLGEQVGDLLKQFNSLPERVDELEEGAKEIVLAVSEGIERTDRAERRIKATIKRARRELESHGLVDPGVEAEADELRLVDGKGSEEGGLQPVRAPVGEPAEEASSIKGVSVDVLRRARGF